MSERSTLAHLVCPPIADELLEQRIRGEYAEMPGMRLTPDQAARLWSLDRGTCVRLLELLVAERFLHLDLHGAYTRNHSGY